MREISVEKSWNTFHRIDFNQLTGQCTEDLLHDKHFTRCSWEAQKGAKAAYRCPAFHRHDGRIRQIWKFFLTLNTIFKELLDTRLASIFLFPLKSQFWNDKERTKGELTLFSTPPAIITRFPNYIRVITIIYWIFKICQEQYQGFISIVLFYLHYDNMKEVYYFFLFSNEETKGPRLVCVLPAIPSASQTHILAFQILMAFTLEYRGTVGSANEWKTHHLP